MRSLTHRRCGQHLIRSLKRRVLLKVPREALLQVEEENVQRPWNMNSFINAALAVKNRTHEGEEGQPEAGDEEENAGRSLLLLEEHRPALNSQLSLATAGS